MYQCLIRQGVLPVVNPGACGYLSAQIMATFHPKAATAQIGSGDGECSAWLADAGFAVTGFDTSEAIAHAGLRQPGIRFQAAEWPELDGLLRALCGIARNEPHVVRWGEGKVYVPLWFVAQRWLIYYWPFFTGPHFIAQRRGESRGGEKPIAFRSTIEGLANEVGPGGLHRLLADLEASPKRYEAALRVIATTIRDGPVTHAGSQAAPVFEYMRGYPPGSGGIERPFGWVVVPEPIWLDICRFHHWIEDSLVLRWAQLSVEMNPGSSVAELLPHLLFSPYQARDTNEVRALVRPRVAQLECVWTGRRLRPEYAVDHVIPFSVWGNNDWWNLLPSDARVNGQKSDALPDRRLLKERREAIGGYWRIYFEQVPVRFGQQVERSLGLTVGHTGWERAMFAGFEETVERVAAIHGLERWRP